MPAAIVPPFPGLLSALGLLGSHIRHDAVAPLIGLEIDPADAFRQLEREADAALAEDRVAPEDRRFERALDLRYVGQEYTLQVPVEPAEPVAAAVERFHAQHERTFGHAAPGLETELVAARLVGLGLRPVPPVRREVGADHAAPARHRSVWFDGPVDTAIYERSALGLGQEIHGPAIVEQLDTTTVIPPGCTATVHESGALIVRP
jgi:N-methylhydantoinase A